MGANWGHQLGLRLWAAPLPRCLYAGDCRERLDHTEHPGVTPRGRPGLEGVVKAVGTNQPTGSHQPKKGSPVQVVGAVLWVAEYSFTVYFVPIKSPLSLAYWLSTSALQQNNLPAHHPGPRDGMKMWWEQVLPGRGQLPPPPWGPWGWDFSLILKAPFCVNTFPSSREPSSKYQGEKWG